MLSSVLRSEQAVRVNIEIMRAFVRMRQVVETHRELAKKIHQQMRLFYQSWPISQTPSAKLAGPRKAQTPSAESSDAQIVQTLPGKSQALPEALSFQTVAARFPLPIAARRRS
jgi:hypothetical protein